jgi:hypothetical protein
MSCSATRAALALLLLAGCASAADPAGPGAAPRQPPRLPALPAPRPGGPGGAVVLGERLAPGESRTAVQGCLAAAGEAEAARFPARPATRTLAPPVTITAAAGGALVTHQLSHACCLRSAVTTRAEERTVVVLETLSGAPCRCMCSSTLRTQLGLSPGEWTVAVDLDMGAGQGARRLASQQVMVRP